MLLILLLVIVSLGLSHWLVEPVVALLQRLLTLGWLGWGLLGLGVWLFAGTASQPGAGDSQDR